MSFAKRLMEEKETKRDRAIAIAIKAGVLKLCEYHGEVFVDDPCQIVGAYKLGNARFEKESLGKIFDDRRDMTDHIKDAVQFAADACWRCTKFRLE